MYSGPEDQEGLCHALFTSSVGITAAPIVRTAASFFYDIFFSCLLVELLRTCSLDRQQRCLRTSLGFEAPDRVPLSQPSLLVVSLVQFGHVLRDHVLIQAV